MSLSINWSGWRSHAWWITPAQQGVESKNRAPTEDNNISPTEDKQLKLARSCSEPCESKQGPNCAQTAQALAKSCESKHLWKKTWNPRQPPFSPNILSWQVLLSENTSLGFPARGQTSHVPVQYFSAETIFVISILFWLPQKTQGNWCLPSFSSCYDAYNPDNIWNSRKLVCLLIWTMIDSL